MNRVASPNTRLCVLALSLWHVTAVSLVRYESTPQNNGDVADASDEFLASVAAHQTLTVTYSTNASYGFCLSAYSALYHGMNLVVLGMGQSFEQWSTYHPLVLYREINVHKFQEVGRLVGWLMTSLGGNENPIVLAMDGSDTLVVGGGNRFLDALKNANASVLYAAEREFYVGWNGSRDYSALGFLESHFPDPKEDDVQSFRNAARFLNGGAYLGRVSALQQMFDVLHQPSLVFANHTIDTEGINDQALGTLALIKSRASSSSALPTIAIDEKSTAFECMQRRTEVVMSNEASRQLGDYAVEHGEFLNVHTRTRPGLLHFNGAKNWESINNLATRLNLGQQHADTLRQIGATQIWLWGPEKTTVRRIKFSELCPNFHPPGSSTSPEK